MAYQETTGTTSRKISLDFVMAGTVSQGRPALEEVWEWAELYKSLRDPERNGYREEQRRGYAKKGIKGASQM